jgi:hypothetical protein
MCPQKYFCTYVLGLKDKDNGKACQGNVFHKNFEILAKCKLAQQNGEKFFIDDNFGKLSTKVKVEKINKLSYDYYESEFPGLMPKGSEKTVLEWTHAALLKLNGEMDPRNQNIYAVEEFFDVEVPHSWADYSYEIDGKTIEGRLRLKGTVDLITREDEVYLHLIDFKTGRRFDWAKETVKEYSDLESDKQLLLYYYALRLKYPNNKFYVSIFYANDHVIDKVLVEGGLFTFVFDDDTMKLAEDMLRKEFEKIKNDRYPKVISKTCAHFKCKYLCAYSKIIPEISTEKPACIFLREEISEKGIEYVTQKYGDLQRMKVYSGGGKLNVDLKDA